ncbi:MAG TPA: hypothetical protein VKU94_06835, partial [Geobacterales bacterium]|nr:hypothetical protein [Geobacterales bacterium]
CYENNIDLVIASAGLDFYIYYLLNSHDIKAICHCMHVLEEDGKLKLIAPDFDRSKFRNFKQAIVKEYINKGYSPIYIGDGFNDFWAAKEAWLVFAVENSVLEKKCADARLRFKSFKHFSEIKQLLLEILS